MDHALANQQANCPHTYPQPLVSRRPEGRKVINIRERR